MNHESPSNPLPTFVSRQVTEERRFFLNLNPSRKSSLEVVCGGVGPEQQAVEVKNLATQLMDKVRGFFNVFRRAAVSKDQISDFSENRAP